MPNPAPESSASPWWTLAALFPAVLLGALATPWPWLPAALGRLHPVVLHFPIALLLVVALLEVLAWLAPRRCSYPVGLLLFLAASGAVITAACGYLLMQGDAIEGPLVERHLRGGIAVAGLACLTLGLRLARGFPRRPGLRLSYRVSLTASCAVLLLTAHDGASLTHGENYLTENLPWVESAPEKARIVFPVQKPVAEWDAYAEVIAPILAARCLDCHGAQQSKGKLALHDWSALLRGGSTGPLFVAGRPDESLLLTRLELPLSHKERMPPRRKPQPTEGELTLLRHWIKAGAPGTGTLAAIGADGPLLRLAEDLPQTFNAAGNSGESAEATEARQAEAVAAARKASSTALAEAQARWPGVVDFESRGSSDLRVNASVLGARFGDDDIIALKALREHLVWLDLSGTAVTDQSAPALATLTRLRLLRLNETKVGDETVEALVALTALESLSLFRTSITDAAAPFLAGLPRIKMLSVAETPMTETARRGLTRP